MLTAQMYNDYRPNDGNYFERAYTGSQENSLYKQIILDSTVSPIIRAKSLIKYSELLENDGQFNLVKSTIDEARAIFHTEEHAFGALLIEMEELRSPSSNIPALQRIARLQEIKVHLETVGNWHDAAWAAQYMSRIALAELSDSKLVESLYEESLKVPGFLQGSVRYILWQLEVFRSLSIRRLQTGRSMTSIKALYDSLDPCEAPRVKDGIASLLSEVYEYLGNDKDAAKWKSRTREYVPLMSNEKSFSERIAKATSFPALDDEMIQLNGAMEQLMQQTVDGIPSDQKSLAVLRMCIIPNEYLDQHQLLGIEATRQLLHHCFQHIESVLPRIDTHSRQSHSGRMLQTKARLCSVEATLGPLNLEELVRLWKISLAAHEKALHHYQHANLPLAAGFASSQLAITHRVLWRLTGMLPNSPWFSEAVKLFDNARIIQKRHGLVDSYQKLTRFILELWFENYKARLNQPLQLRESWVMWFKSLIGMPVDSPLEKTKEFLHQLEQIIDRKRHDLSALTVEEALDAKQKLRNNEDVQILYATAIPFYALQNDMDNVWLNVQKAKARSVSDLLGLGIIVPAGLANCINLDNEAKNLLGREQELLREAQNNKTDSQFIAQTKLDAHREMMKQNEHLREMLELSEGVPVTISRLRALSESLQGQRSKRRILYADYVIVGGRISLLVALPESIAVFDLRSTEAQLDDWRKRHFQADQFLDHDDSDDNIAALQELTPLVEPLGQVSKEGDLIVLCASGALHAIPLHAAPLGAESSGKCLIDRNPIVHCPSMTVFEKCVTRARQTPPKDSTSGQAMLAVYETPNGPDWEEQRAQTYDTFASLAEGIEDARVFTGADVTGSRFREECENAKIIHFLGHCNSSTENTMQHLVIAAGSQDVPSQQRANGVEKHADNDLEVLTAPFTVSDLFATSIRTMHFNLIACGSASQVIGSGDEPWGIVTALLCAGATSVEGTMWPIQVGTGETFMEMLYKGLGSSGEDGIVDLAVAHQRAVKRLKKKRDTQAPCHWAAFVLHGAWFYRS